MANDFNRRLALLGALVLAGCEPRPAAPPVAAPPPAAPTNAPAVAALPRMPRPPGVVREAFFATARERAAREGRDLLVLARGSDWCAPGEVFRSNIWTAVEFAHALGDGFVLVDVDRKQQRTAADEAYAKEHHKGFDFGVNSYPMVIAYDATGRVYGTVATRELTGPLDAVVTNLLALRGRREERDGWWARAAGLEGVEKARALGQGLDALQQGLGHKGVYKPVLEAIRKADAGDLSGYAARLTFDGHALVNRAREMAEEKKFEDMLRELDDKLRQAGHTDEQKQWVHTGRFIVFNRWPEHRPQAIAALRDILALGADTDMGRGAAVYLKRLEEKK